MNEYEKDRIRVIRTTLFRYPDNNYLKSLPRNIIKLFPWDFLCDIVDESNNILFHVLKDGTSIPVNNSAMEDLRSCRQIRVLKSVRSTDSEIVVQTTLLQRGRTTMDR